MIITKHTHLSGIAVWALCSEIPVFYLGFGYSSLIINFKNCSDKGSREW